MTAVDDRTRAVVQDRAARDEDFWATLMPEAAGHVIVSGLGSVAMLQRKMRLPYATVCDLMAELCEAGIVGPDKGATPRDVLVPPDGLADALARLAELADPDQDDPGGTPEEVVVADVVDGPPPRVNLVKPPIATGDDPGGEAGDGWDTWSDDWDDDQPGGELELRPRHPLARIQYVTLAPVVGGLATRARQATARQLVWVADQPLVSRSLAVGRQAPHAMLYLVLHVPHGVSRVAHHMTDWLRDAHTTRLLAKHSEAGEGESYAKVASARADTTTRAVLAATVVLALVLVGLAWWAPAMFAGLLGVAVFVGVACLAPCKSVQEWLWGIGFAGLCGGVAWWFGEDLAAMVPRPPWWAWWVIGGLAVLAFGWLGRETDKPILTMPVGVTAGKPQPITAPMVVEALFRIGVTGMTSIAADKGMRDEIRVMAPGVATSAHGYIIELELPPGVTAEMVVAKRGPLAGALRRDLGCVWPSGNEDRHPGYLRLFISHKPMNKAVQPPWPLAAGNVVDIFEPMPLFTDEEMRWVYLTLAGTPHLAVGGASGFGKSVWLRQVSCGVAFDPRVRIVVIDGKRSGDLDHVRKLAHAFHEGADPEDVEAVVGELRGLVAEYLKRSKFLSALPPEERSPKVTSALATKYPDQLSPIVVFYDEVQEGTQYGIKSSREDKAIRDEITGQLTRLSRVGRSAGIYLVLASQRPEADVIPSSIMGNCSIRVAFKVSDQVHNDQILGTSARKNGIDATMFGTRDKGLAWLKGGDDVDAQVVRSWSEMVDVGLAVELADKAYELRKARGMLTGQALDDGIEDAEIVYDIVQDAEQVLRHRGVGKAQWGELVAWLQEFRPGQYATLTEEQLSASIRTAVPKPRDVRSGNSVRKGVYLSDLRKQDDDDAA